MYVVVPGTPSRLPPPPPCAPLQGAKLFRGCRGLHLGAPHAPNPTPGNRGRYRLSGSGADLLLNGNETETPRGSAMGAP